MSLELQPDDGKVARLQQLEALLTQASGIADLLGLDFAAIRIEEARAVVGEQAMRLDWTKVTTLN